MCTIAAGNSNGNIIVGRNFDWLQCGGRLQVQTSKRIYGYQTIPHILIEQQGIDRPYEGINKHGVFIGMTSIQTDVSHVHSICEFDALGIIKYVLERAETAVGGVKLLGSVKLNYNQNGNYTVATYLIADRLGNAILYMEGMEPIICRPEINELCILRAGKSIDTSLIGKDEWIEEQKEVFQKTLDMKTVCKNAASHDTAWSTIYDLKQAKLTLYIEQNYDNPFEYNIDELLSKGETTLDFGNLKLSRIRNREDLVDYIYKIYSKEPSGFPILNE
jgi:predicted choloylglycine hydrolase